MKFVFNDESEINSYGFKIPNSGILLERFNANPVMLDQHWNNTDNVLGRWKDVAINGTKLEGVAEFDMEDEDAKKIAGKVERGYIKGCSMGVTFDRDKMKQQPDGSWVLTSCELYEVSIVAVPSNKASLRLFSATGEELKEDEVKLAISELQADWTANGTQNKNKDMFKITLSAQTLTKMGLSHNPETEGELMGAIETIVSKLSAAESNLQTEKLAHDATKQRLKDATEVQAKALVEEALLAGKITADEKEGFIKDATENYALTAKLLGRIPAKTSLSAKGLSGGAGNTNPKNPDEFEKLSSEAKLAFKTDFPEEYKALWK